MKLVEILARKWSVWRGGDAVEQTCLGDVFCSTKGRELMFGTELIADDQGSAVVTREQWQAERERIEAESKHANKDLQSAAKRFELKSYVGGGVVSSKEVFADAEKQYDQGLLDKVAKDALCAMLASDREYMVNDDPEHFAAKDSEFAICAFDFADAFMAERAKRMKEKK